MLLLLTRRHDAATALRLYLKLAWVVDLWVLTGHKLLDHLISGKVANRVHRLQLFRGGVLHRLLDALPILHVTRSATRMHFLAFPDLLNILGLHVVGVRCSTCCICSCGWTGTWRVLAHLHKMNVLRRLTLTAVASLGRSALFEAFVFRILIRISVNVHALGLYLVHLVAGASSTRFHGTLINIPRRVMHKTAVILICWWRGCRHYLLSLLYLQLHLLNLVHMLNLSFTQIALNLLILRRLGWRFLERRTVGCIAICILMWHDINLKIIRFLVLPSNNGDHALVRRRQHILLLWGVDYHGSALLITWEIAGAALLLIICNVLLFLNLSSLLRVLDSRRVGNAALMRVALVVALVDNLRSIRRLQMYIIQCFPHMYGSLNTVIRIFLCLLDHDVGAKILLFRPLIIIMPICSRLPIGAAAIAVSSCARILSRVSPFVLDVDKLRRHTLQLLPIGRRCCILLLALHHVRNGLHRICVR